MIRTTDLQQSRKGGMLDAHLRLKNILTWSRMSKVRIGRIFPFHIDIVM